MRKPKEPELVRIENISPIAYEDFIDSCKKEFSFSCDRRMIKKHCKKASRSFLYEAMFQLMHRSQELEAKVKELESELEQVNHEKAVIDRRYNELLQAAEDMLRRNLRS